MRDRIEQIEQQLTQPSSEETSRVRDALNALAQPRLSGTEGAEAAASELRGRFEALGYEIRELPFEFSAFPGRFGLMLLGGLFLSGSVTGAVLLAANLPIPALAVLGCTGLLIGVFSLLWKTTIDRLPLMRIETSNWLVHRPGTEPEILVMAHRDSKSQLAPIPLRAMASGLAAFSWLALLVIAIVLVAAPGLTAVTLSIVFGAIAALAGLLLLLGWTSNASPGALDDATGLAALLGLAHRLQDDAEVGFLVTDGEELGLAGARAVADSLPAVRAVINLDVLDDSGSFHIVERHGMPARGSAPHVAAALTTASRFLDYPSVRRGLPPGIMVDHVPLVDAGLPALTVMRGGMGSLWRVHRSADGADRLDGSGAAAAVALVEGALRLMRLPHSRPQDVLPEALRVR